MRGAGESTIVVGRGGWLRLPQEFLERAGIGSGPRLRSRTIGSSSSPRAATDGGPRSRRRAAEPRHPGETIAVVRGVSKTHGRGATAAHVFSGLESRFEGGAAHGRDRALGLGQDDAAPPARRARASGRGRGRGVRRADAEPRSRRPRGAAPAVRRARRAADPGSSRFSARARTSSWPRRSAAATASTHTRCSRRSASGAGRSARLAPLGGRAGSRRGRAGAGGPAAPAAGRRADSPPGSGERAHARGAPLDAGARDRRCGRLRHARPGGDRAGRRGARARGVRAVVPTPASRLAPVEGISLEELQLAARNHGMPLEALRFPITPVGLHYLLIHYDVPVVDAGGLAPHGRRRARALARARRPPRAAHSRGDGDDGVRRERPRPARPAAGQPALAPRGRRHGALDAERRFAPLLEEAGVSEGTVEVLFTGLDRGVEGGEEQRFQRSAPAGRGACETTCCSRTR